jgi:hypothetical protein
VVPTDGTMITQSLVQWHSNNYRYCDMKI